MRGVPLLCFFKGARCIIVMLGGRDGVGNRLRWCSLGISRWEGQHYTILVVVCNQSNPSFPLDSTHSSNTSSLDHA